MPRSVEIFFTRRTTGIPTYTGTNPGRAFCNLEDVTFKFSSCSRSCQLSMRVVHLSRAAHIVSCLLAFAQLPTAFLWFNVSRNRFVRTIASAENFSGSLMSMPFSFVTDLTKQELNSSTSSSGHSRTRSHWTAVAYSGSCFIRSCAVRVTTLLIDFHAIHPNLLLISSFDCPA